MRLEPMKKLARFVAVGCVGAICDYATRELLLHLGVIGWVARACSYIVGSIVAYYLNSHFTFGGDRSSQEKLRAAAVYLFCFLAAVLTDFLFRRHLSDIPHYLFWAWFVSQGVATTLNFLLQNFWVFQKPPRMRDSN
ncbi:GtrA family protein [Corynebacterium sp. DSM 45110]|uniref:GtrA family protein n=2 Tax=Corynebacterium suicordis TaxID=203264 RepID=A0ABR9ZGM4_9CORY|nr:GtrA family protein [Corynebacterium suicordis DSM 45110]